MRALQTAARVLASATFAVAASLAVGSEMARAARSDCPPGAQAPAPCPDCPWQNIPGPCTHFEDRGVIDLGQACCDPACVNFRSNPSGSYEDWLYIYGWSYRDARNRTYRASYIGGKGGTEGPWTWKDRFHDPICN
ncbi:MAG TPA: hypothetical protein VGL20_19475 [Candidatus Dormibacteraeota bacterium]